ncbi:hypothetical protein C8R44DRAFT_739492 [Mycena epipterygia]|nr:hypothetical protein C8R44DRAFT_739492 [Mycena epipterygia]
MRTGAGHRDAGQEVPNRQSTILGQEHPESLRAGKVLELTLYELGSARHENFGFTGECWRTEGDRRQIWGRAEQSWPRFERVQKNKFLRHFELLDNDERKLEENSRDPKRVFE